MVFFHNFFMKWTWNIQESNQESESGLKTEIRSNTSKEGRNVCMKQDETLRADYIINSFISLGRLCSIDICDLCHDCFHFSPLWSHKLKLIIYVEAGRSNDSKVVWVRVLGDFFLLISLLQSSDFRIFKTRDFKLDSAKRQTNLLISRRLSPEIWIHYEIRGKKIFSNVRTWEITLVKVKKSERFRRIKKEIFD